jgi:transposase InsO family protein
MVFAKLHKGGLTDGNKVREALKIRYKWTVLKYAEVCRTVTQACREFNVDLNEKLAEWERFYNLDRPHRAFKGKTPYEALRSSLE